LDEKSQGYVEEVLKKQTGYDVEHYSGELADSLLRWYPEAHAAYMRTPLLIAHGSRNALHPPTEAEALFSAYGGPKELYWIEGAGHTEWMFDDNPHFQALSARIVKWLQRILPD
jgi:hypothetical protein